MRMSVEAIDYCQRGGRTISCPVTRPPPRQCVNLPSTTDLGICSCSSPPPEFPVQKFPNPPVCPGWCAFLWFLFAAALLLVILCIIAWLLGKDDEPQKPEKPSICQRLLYYWAYILSAIRRGLKWIFCKKCPSQCYVVILQAVTPIGRCIMCRSKDQEKEDSEKTERTSDQTNTPTHHLSSTGSLRHHDLHLDDFVADKGYDETRTPAFNNKVDSSNACDDDDTNQDQSPASLRKQYRQLEEEVKPEHQPLFNADESESTKNANMNNSGNHHHHRTDSCNNTPIQLEISKLPASPTTRTRRLEPSDEYRRSNSPTAV